MLVDDVQDLRHQKPLHLAIVLGDDDRTLGRILHRRLAQGKLQIDHRNGLPAQIGDTPYRRVAVGHRGERRALDDLSHLEHIDPVTLLAIQAKQQQFHTVMTNQTSSLINPCQYVRHQGLPLRCSATYPLIGNWPKL